MSEMTEQQLRVWAAEQTIKHHSGIGFHMDRVLQEAEKLIAWVNRTEQKS